MFRAGEQGRFWYAVLGGSLEVRYHAPDNDSKVSQLSSTVYNIYHYYLSASALIFYYTKLYFLQSW